MPYWIHILCKSEVPLIRQELIDFVHAGGFFTDPRFDPPSGSADAKAIDWGHLALLYQADERPLVIHRRAGGPLAAPLSEAASTLAEWGVDPALVARIREAHQMVSLELPWRLPSDAAWAMIDQLQLHTARSFDGIVYAEGDGIYDASLSPLFRLPQDDPRRITPADTEP